MNIYFQKKQVLFLSLLIIAIDLFPQTFTEQTGIILPGLSSCSVAWGDYNNDGNLDLLLTGYSGTDRIAKIYCNNGNNTFTDQTIITLTGGYYSSVAWGDYNNDGNLDILLTGQDAGNNTTSKVYRNNGDNTFTEQTSISLTGVYYGSVAWGDYNNDGNLDILLTGENASSKKISKLYLNNGNNTFTEQTDIILTPVEGGSVAWGDYDNDGILDILLTGFSISGPISKIYHNNGNNTFTEQTNISLTGVYNSSVAWGDYDNDGYLDILLTGDTGTDKIAKIYRNNGDNSFTEQTGISLIAVGNSSAAWGDYDNDGILDILLTGYTGTDRIAKIFRNNGDNSFTEQTGIVLTGVLNGSIACGDYDNDGDLDILLTGAISGSSISKIYKNNCVIINKNPDQPENLDYEISGTKALLKWNKVTTDETSSKSITYNIRVGRESGTNNFVSSNSALNGFRNIVAMGNIQMDTTYILNNLRWDTTYYASVQAIDNSYKGGAFSGEVQIKISAIQPSNLYVTYINNTSLMVRWKRGNGDRCIVFAKEGTSGTANPPNFTTYYANPAFGEGSPIGTTGWFCIYKGDGDSVLLSGLNQQRNYLIHAIEFQNANGLELYSPVITENLGTFSTGLFTEQTSISLTGVRYSSVAWADCDKDGDLDILLTGRDQNNIPISKIFQNNGDNTFTLFPGISLTGVRNSSVDWGDYNNDGNLDILLTGYANATYASKVYRNNGNNTFAEQSNILLTVVQQSSVTWGDYDNDGYLDILLTGFNSGPISKIYHNDGNNTFTEQTNISLTGVYYSSVAWGDYDNDGNLDILLTGQSDTGPIAKIYHNNGDNSFTEKTDISLIGVAYSSVAWGDYNNDGNLDILLTGYTGTERIAKIYSNNGNNTFTDQTSISLTGVYNGSVAWGDYDNDGKLDILLAGQGIDYPGIVSKIYHNNGDNTFTELTGISLTGVYYSSVAWGDYDNDGDLDILITGDYYDGIHNCISKIYRNNLIMKAGNIQPNAKPMAPTGLTSIISPGSIKLNWLPVNNDETPTKTISYNIRYKIKDVTQWKFAPHAADDGFRRLPAIGNIQLNKSFVLKNLPSGVYSWQVQAVDQGYQGGAWSDENSFEVKNVQTFYSADIVCLEYPTYFSDQSVATDGIASWKWDFKDGTTSNLQNPVHSFETSGTLNVKLVITSNGGIKDSLEKSIIVKPRPITGFSATTACQGKETVLVNLTNASGLNITSWSWDYGDGKGSTFQNPVSHGYLSAGDYQLTLIAVADNGCLDTIVKTVNVGAYPVASITANAPLAFCYGDSVTLSVISNPDYSYEWMLNNTGITNANSNNYTAKITGNYSVIVLNTKGSCSDTSSQVSVTRLDKPGTPAIVTENYQAAKCPGENQVVLNVDQPVTGYSYQWKRNGTQISDATTTSYQGQGFLPAGDYTVIANLTGCKTESAIKTIIYDDAPEKPLLYAQGATVWYLVCSNDSSSNYKWFYNGTLVPGADKYVYIANQKLGKYNVSVSNEKGCFTMSDTLIIPKGLTGIEDADPFEGLKIYPNPTPGLFTIEMDNNIFGELDIMIFTGDGRRILNIRFEKTSEHFQSQIDLSGQGKGIYLINLLIDKYKSNRKLVID